MPEQASGGGGGGALKRQPSLLFIKTCNNTGRDKINSLLSGLALGQGGGRRGEVWLLFLSLELSFGKATTETERGVKTDCRVKHAETQQSTRGGAAK